VTEAPTQIDRYAYGLNNARVPTHMFKNSVGLRMVRLVELCDRQTDGHGVIAHTAARQHRSVARVISQCEWPTAWSVDTDLTACTERRRSHTCIAAAVRATWRTVQCPRYAPQRLLTADPPRSDDTISIYQLHRATDHQLDTCASPASVCPSSRSSS